MSPTPTITLRRVLNSKKPGSHPPLSTYLTSVPAYMHSSGRRITHSTVGTALATQVQGYVRPSACGLPGAARLQYHTGQHLSPYSPRGGCITLVRRVEISCHRLHFFLASVSVLERSLGFDKCVMPWIRHYSVIQSDFTALDVPVLHASVPPSSPPTTDPSTVPIVLPFAERHRIIIA